MAVQTIGGSDLFGPVHYAESANLGESWTEPRPIPGLGRKQHPDGTVEAVCDTVPQHHPQTGSVIFMGWNVYYKDNKLTRPGDERWPVYVVRHADGSWTEPRKLEWSDPAASRIYGSNCSQRVVLGSGDVLVPLTYASHNQSDRGVGTVRCAFDGDRLQVRDHGNTLRLGVKRGLLEPSVTLFRNRFLMTIRAEDGHGYVSASDDGLQWPEQQPWTWEDGGALTMSTTQQHWIEHSDGLYLAYTRRSAHNVNVMRWRSPLYAARVDDQRLVLLRGTEVELIPMSGDGINEPDSVARMGNFHTTPVSPETSIVTVGETLPASGWIGNTLQATIHWNRPNQLL